MAYGLPKQTSILGFTFSGSDELLCLSNYDLVNTINV